MRTSPQVKSSRFTVYSSQFTVHGWRYLHVVPNNPFGNDPSALAFDIEAIGPEVAWLYDAGTGEIRAVIAHDDAVSAGLVPSDSAPGETTRDVVTY